MKKLIYIILIWISLLFIVSGCGGSSNNNSASLEPQIEVSYPNQGTLLAIAKQTNGDAYLEYYGDKESDTLSKIVGYVKGSNFEFHPLSNSQNEFVMDIYKIKYSYNTDTTVNMSYYVNDNLIYPEPTLYFKAPSKEDDCEVSRQAIGHVFLAMIHIGSVFSTLSYEEYVSSINMEDLLVYMITEIPNLKVAFENYQNDCLQEETEIVTEATVGVYANVNITGYSGDFLADEGVAFLLEDGYPGFLALTSKEDIDETADMIIMKFNTTLVAGNTYELKYYTDPTTQIVLGFSSPQLLDDAHKIVFYTTSGSVTLTKFGTSYGDEIIGSFNCEVIGDNGLKGSIDGTFNGTLQPASYYE